MKKLQIIAITAVLSSACIVLPVFAHGHHRQYQAQTTQTTSYPVCTVADCTQTGHHMHNNAYYCGYNHSSGYCDGSCATATQTTQNTGHHGGHHGCH